MSGKMKTVCKVIGTILVLLLLAGIVGVVLKFTNGGNETFKTFYVVHDGEEIFASESTMSLDRGDTHRFDVKYTFDIVNSEPRDYSVKVVSVATEDTEFKYSVDGKELTYTSGIDLTAGFTLKKYDTYFVLELPEGIVLQDILNKVYEGKEVAIPEEQNMPGLYLFSLVIASYNQSVVYHIDFCFYQGVTGVIFEQGGLYL